MNKIKENNTEVGFKVKKNKNKFKFSQKYTERNEKYYCKECDYQTDCLARIKAHLISHSNSRPYHCKYDSCGQAFKRHNSLKRHIKTLHLNERLYACTICHKKFSQSQSLNDHVFTHLDNKTFKCMVDGCNKHFQTPKSLKAHQNRRHMKLILNMSPENSHQLNKSFENMKTGAQEELNAIIAQKTTSLTTNTNINNVCPYELFKCQVKACGQSFRLQRNLRSHYKYTHSDLYNKKTKSIDLLATDDNTDTESHNSKDSSAEIVSEESNSHSLKPISHNSIIDKISVNTYAFECNFAKCCYKTKSFERIADHFTTHWQQTPI